MIIAKYKSLSWHRGLVTDVSKSGQVNVLFVDFGESVWMDPKQNECHPDFLKTHEIPIQALRCKLDNILPKDGQYSEHFLQKMRSKFTNQSVQVEITRKNTKLFPLAVILHVTDKENNKENLARYLINQDVAEIMTIRENWYAPDIVKEQNNEAFHIQPILEPFDADEYQTLIEISQTFPDFMQLPKLENKLIPVNISYISGNLIFAQPISEGKELFLYQKLNQSFLNSNIFRQKFT